MSIVEEMFCLLRNEIDGQTLPDNIEYDAERLIALSKKHDLAHLVSDALIRNGLITDLYKDFRKIRKQKLLAIYRDANRTDFYEEVKKLLSQAKIEFVPMKGILVKELYPESWMRSSCDLDILIHDKDIERATSVLIEGGLTTDNKINYHDVSFFKDKNHLELHFNICEDNKQFDKLLNEVWNYTVAVGEYESRETNVFFVFHHIAHMAYHFLSGGCGIRPFIDLRLMRKKGFYSDNELIALLNECGLKPFYDAVCDLTDVWFGDKEHTELTKAMSDYIICGGVYGNVDNGSTAGVARNKGSKIKYMTGMAFPSYESMCFVYPTLKKHKILLPFCYIHRLFSKLFGKERRRVRARIKNIKSSQDSNIKEVKVLLHDLGIDGL